MNEGYFYHLGMWDFGSSGDEARLHVLMRRNDSPILNLLGDGADFNQNSQQGFAGTVGLVYPTGGEDDVWTRALALLDMQVEGSHLVAHGWQGSLGKNKILPVVERRQRWLWRNGSG